jgi:hypothetical protein
MRMRPATLARHQAYQLETLAAELRQIAAALETLARVLATNAQCRRATTNERRVMMADLYDPACADLARYVLQETPGALADDTATIDALAVTIQRAIEDWITANVPIDGLDDVS